MRRPALLFALALQLGATLASATSPLACNPGHVDFNGDGKADLAWNHAASRSSGVWLMDVPAQPVMAAAPVQGPPGGQIRLLADFDGDGKTDILWRTDAGAYWIGLMNGTTQTSLVKMLDAGTGWEVITALEINGDGKADLLWRDPNNVLGGWLMDGTTILKSAFIVGVSPSQANVGDVAWKVRLVGDMDGDGIEDIVWQHDDGRVAITKLDSQLFAADTRIVQVAGTGWSPVALGDFNADGLCDIVFQHGSDAFAVWLMKTGLVPASAMQIRAGAGNVAQVRVQDLDGDGKSDLLWQMADGSVEAWLMDGTTTRSVTPLMGAQSTWALAGGDDYNPTSPSPGATPFVAPARWGSGVLWRDTMGAYGYWLFNPSYATDAGGGMRPFGISSYGLLLQGGSGWEVAP